jgi:hypothetical protein
MMIYFALARLRTRGRGKEDDDGGALSVSLGWRHVEEHGDTEIRVQTVSSLAPPSVREKRYVIRTEPNTDNLVRCSRASAHL